MNPSGQPFPQQFGGAPPPAGNGSAREALNIPGILLLVFGALSLLWALYSLVQGGSREELEKALSDPNLPEAAKEIISKIAPAVERVGKLFSLLAIVLSGLMVYGSIQMRNLKSYGMAMAAAIIGLLPCTSCCCVTLPIGIWALTVLAKPDVKAAFT